MTDTSPFMAELTTQINQLPQRVQAVIGLVPATSARLLRQRLFNLYPATTDARLGVVPELIDLAIALNPPTFRPKPLTVSEVAMAHANAYAAQMVTGRAHQLLNQSQLAPAACRTAEADIEKIWLGNLDRLTLNFNQRMRVADYLNDSKSRFGQLAALTCFLTTRTHQTPATVTDLTMAIGESLGVAQAILDDVQATNQVASFQQQLLTGNYTLPLLFAVEAEPDYFHRLFNQSSKPTNEQLITTQALVLQSGEKPALEIAAELINQAELDGLGLSDDLVKSQLTGLLTAIMAEVKGE
ncbi:hypothetical protein GPK34_11835 [Secundilactobacillus kimchicus]|nr:hypothetical protein [Secundilactobacillus kimchicus]MBT9672717.1 hypothetical protein [Secundilactobacillus kimchicus]